MNKFPIKSKVIAIALVLALATSCSGGSNSNALSGDEACQEAIRLMGKGTDVSMKGISDPDGLKANLITLAFEYGQLTKKTDDKSLKAILVQMQSGLKTGIYSLSLLTCICFTKDIFGNSSASFSAFTISAGLMAGICFT